MSAAKIFLAAVLVAMFVGPSLAANLNGNQIKRLVNNKKVNLETTWGSFPLKYNSNRRVTGDGSGLGLARFFAPKETGKWWIASNQLCQQFPTWYKGRTFCFSIQQVGVQKIRWRRSDGYSGTATIE